MRKVVDEVLIQAAIIVGTFLTIKGQHDQAAVILLFAVLLRINGRPDVS
jgi:hypothetical protein